MRLTVFTLGLLLALAPAPRADEPPKKPAGPTKDELDKSIDRALEYLKSTQLSDGGWKANNNEVNPAVTSLAVMAFLSAGHVPGEGRYGETIEKGIRWVLAAQADNGLIAREGQHEMYHHGICTLMLAEAAGMTDGKLGDEIRQKLKKAVQIILKAQRGGDGDDRGGWRYHLAAIDQPNADMSVTGWQLMALRAAKNLGCDVPAENIDRAVEYIKRSQDRNGGGFAYFPNSRVSIACTGTGILALELCGKDQHKSDAVLKAGAVLLKNPPTFKQPFCFYSLYYCSQATFQIGDNYWEFFRPQMHDLLFKNQRDDGAWVAGGGDGTYGPSYSTAMCVLALTVEYRFLPIYQRGEEPTDKK
jgi:hypothetical protein